MKLIELTKKQELEILRGNLETERQSFIPHYRELADYILPRRPQFTLTDTNRGDRRNNKIVDSTATLAARTTRSGMMSGVTSPARPWFRVTTPDPALAEFTPVKVWLYTVSERMTDVFLRSNLYNILPIIYSDMAIFGTGAMVVEAEPYNDVIRFHALPVGSYMIANDDNHRVRVFFRELKMTIRQLINKFGKVNESMNIDWSNFSLHVKECYDRKQYETWIDVYHTIIPNEDYDPNKPDSKRYSSFYYEKGGDGRDREERFLRKAGFDFFPVLCPRWEVSGEDVYATDCPGMTALGDIKELQLQRKRKMQAIEKMINPPMIAPTSMRNSKLTILPGDTNFIDERDGYKGFRPAHEVNIRITEISESMKELQDRIRRCFYEDLFLMLAQSDRRQITAREIDERHEEKLLALGPVLEQLNQDLLDPLIDITFSIMLNQGLIPPAPPELQGIKLKVEYISIMAQAQKLIGTSGIEKFLQFTGNIVAATQQTEVLDKIDFDQMVDVYGDLMSINPSIIRSDDAVAAMRQQRQQALAAQKKMEMLEQITGSVKNIASSAKDLSGAEAAGGGAPESAPDLSALLAGMGGNA